MRSLAVLTTGRQDWGILRPVCVALRASLQWSPAIVAGGLHLDRDTASLVVDAGFPIAARLDATAGAGAAQAAAMVAAIAEALHQLGSHALLVVGDRSETTAAALGAAIARVPIVHLHGGEETEGAIDNTLRHAITKLAHLHLVSHADHARRVRQMGEADDHVIVVGAPGLDNFRRDDLPDRAAIERSLGIALEVPVVIVTHHPATLGAAPAAEIAALVRALSHVDATYVITLPNNDAGNDVVRRELLAFATAAPRRLAVEALGELRYAGLVRCADAMIGNSSSGLIEAPIAQLPVVNVGDRQRGRLRGVNVIDTPADTAAIEAALRRALDPATRRALADTTSPYGDGHSGERVRAALDAWTPPVPPRKRFVDRACGD